MSNAFLRTVKASGNDTHRHGEYTIGVEAFASIYQASKLCHMGDLYGRPYIEVLI